LHSQKEGKGKKEERRGVGGEMEWDVGRGMKLKENKNNRNKKEVN
jgi:hypothetical protein